jgi:hypothetical protein
MNFLFFRIFVLHRRSVHAMSELTCFQVQMMSSTSTKVQKSITRCKEAAHAVSFRPDGKLMVHTRTAHSAQRAYADSWVSALVATKESFDCFQLNLANFRK